MRKLLLITLTILFTFYSFGQDSLKLKKIDSLVYLVKHSSVPVQSDSIITDKPEYGLFSKNYISVLVDNRELKKYINTTYIRTTSKGTSEDSNGENAFYFYKNKLVKAEEFLVMGGKKLSVEWYFENDKLVHYNSSQKSDKFEERAVFIIEMTNGILKTFRDRGAIE